MIAPADELSWHVLSDEDRAALRRAAEEVFPRHPWVLAAWHHGSSAVSDRPARDMDIALVAQPIPGDLAVADELGRELATASGIRAIPFDVRIVNGASPVFLGEMLSHGSLLYESDRAGRIEWEAAALSFWLDFKPVWKRVRKAALTRWARG